eukprot:CAMPEP_0115001950 /NCGR_PEP_ID=MMETSP0216-20121206/17711_1 /TAXON_ID=223996 /ORGANISM="Protocruzia adherens, Strain Boccale" /LENGTH=217 /DNA_ID=CAMNT_0002367443 /DNA_START=328 /DNA_END=981 /DNA_ORIENTATION=-
MKPRELKLVEAVLPISQDLLLRFIRVDSVRNIQPFQIHYRRADQESNPILSPDEVDTFLVESIKIIREQNNAKRRFTCILMALSLLFLFAGAVALIWEDEAALGLSLSSFALAGLCILGACLVTRYSGSKRFSRYLDSISYRRVRLRNFKWKFYKKKINHSSFASWRKGNRSMQILDFMVRGDDTKDFTKIHHLNASSVIDDIDEEIDCEVAEEHDD